MIMNSCLVVNESTSLKEQTSFNPLQFTIDLHRADQAMFEAVINLDLMDAFNESGVISVSESEMEMQLEAAGNGILQKIKNLIAKAKQAIKNFITKIKDKFDDIFNKDKKLYEKYGKDFEWVVANPSQARDSSSGDFEVPDYDNIDNVIIGAEKALLTLAYPRYIQKCEQITNLNDLAKILEEFNQKCESAKKSMQDRANNIVKKVSGTSTSGLVSAIKGNGLENIRNNIKMGKRNRIKKVTAIMNNQLKELDVASNNIKIKQVDGSPHDKKLDLESRSRTDGLNTASKYNTEFSIISSAQKFVNTMMGVYTKVLAKEYSMERKIFVQLAKANPQNKKEEEKESKNESAYNIWAIGEMSDFIMEQRYEEMGIY